MAIEVYEDNYITIVRASFLLFIIGGLIVFGLIITYYPPSLDPNTITTPWWLTILTLFIFCQWIFMMMYIKSIPRPNKTPEELAEEIVGRWNNGYN